ncbi:MAG TPA: hypothetical protein VGN65_13410, partial [Casimicrobiaceae bacterium]
LVLASVRESGDGPRGLIDASDRAARALRGKIGESFRSVQASPPLADVTTPSLEALRAYSAAQRANNLENDPPKAVRLWREAVRLDTTFASAWIGISTALGNIGAPRAGIDSAVEHAYNARDHLTESERARLMIIYAARGPHRDRSKAVGLYLESARTAASPAAALVNAGEEFRSWRDFAQAESLNRAAVKVDSMDAIGMLNIVQLQIDRGHTDSAAATLELIKRRTPSDAGIAVMSLWVAYAKADLRRTQEILDSTMKLPGLEYRLRAARSAAQLAVLRGQLTTGHKLWNEASRIDSARVGEQLRDSLASISTDAWFHGANARDIARIDAAVAKYPLRSIAQVDRPYFDLATYYARGGKPDRARSMIAAYNADVVDTAMRRLQAPDLHKALGEIALASNDPRTALAEFRASDIWYDGKPASECGSCTDFNVARAFDAANMTDSTIAAYERFINTPYWDRLSTVDPIGVAGAHKRLGELYEAKGSTGPAITHYQQFVELWKNADPEFQPLVGEVKRKVARLVASEKR